MQKQFMHYVFNSVCTKLTLCQIGKTKPRKEQLNVDKRKRNSSILTLKVVNITLSFFQWIILILFSGRPLKRISAKAGKDKKKVNLKKK